MQCIVIILTCYHKRYDIFSLSVAWFGVIFNVLPCITVKFIKNIYIDKFFLKVMVTHGDTLQMVQNQANIRENIQ